MSRRQPKAVGGRTRRHEVWVTPEQEAVIGRAAAEDDVTVSRFLAEAGVAVARAEEAAGMVQTVTQRRAQLAELFALRHEVATAALEVKRVGVNVNQVAKATHQGQPVPVQEMREFLVAEQRFLADTRATVARIDTVIDALAEAGGLA